MVLISNWCIVFFITLSATFFNSVAAGTTNGSDYRLESAVRKIPAWQCVAVPSSVEVDQDIWKEEETPAEDDLDRFMVNKTGCSYKAVKKYETLIMTPVPFDGELFEWRGAVRAPSYSYFGVTWGAYKGYSFWHGWENNTVTRIRFGYDDEVLSELPAADVLSADRYVPFYIQLQAGTLTFSQGCSNTPLFTREVTVPRGQRIKMLLQPWAARGGKYLFGCPV